MAVFSKISKADQEVIMNSFYWDSVLNTAHYQFPDVPKLPTGKAAHAELEHIDKNLYKPNAKMVSFRVQDKNRLMNWLKCLAYRYHYQFGKRKEFKCEWIDRLKDGSKELIDEVLVRLLSVDIEGEEMEKIITINVYFSTHLITVQGNNYLHWVDDEFPHLKSVVENMSTQDNSETKVKNLLDVSAEYDEFQSFLSSNKKTFSTPRIISPNTVASPNNMQTIESGICSRFSTLDRKIDVFNNNLLEKINNLEEIISRNSQENEINHSVLQSRNKELENKINYLLAEMGKKEEKIKELKKEISRLKEDKKENKNEKEQQKENKNEEKDNEMNVMLEENTSVKCLIPTANRYEALSTDVEEPGAMHQTRSDISCEMPKKKQDLPIEVIMDSHGKWLDPKWMYKNKDLRITVLGAGKKNIKGAMEHIQSITFPKHLIIGVGCNDLSNENSEDVSLRFKEMITKNPTNCVLHILPIFERYGDSTYNQKVTETNRELQKLCEENGVNFIKMNKISSENPQNYTRDGVHFSNIGRKNLVIMIKQHNETI
ncbi:uncharacterized protein LOC133180580 [Saccostrea echinata]|uniref:uncharacterized protein LOC133180580 n=1 Tax=Saccostrea echinata TaxID=191078 RepID=UPI002A7F18BC|nr:uncharacterized protein LOC133180580 [Saccostrea echinata]